MPSVKDLKAVLDAGAARERAFLVALSPEELAAEGTLEHWSAKDTLAHIGHWRQQMADKLSELHDPKIDPWEGDIDAKNAEVYERYCGAPWEDVHRMVEQSVENLKQAVARIDEADLANPDLDPWREGHQPWRSVIGNGFTHPMTHLGQYLINHGEKGPALRLQQETNQTLLSLDDSPDMRGVAIYNLACIQAQLGEKELALAGLREALQLAPRLVEWSKEDPDLVSLHGDPGYQALYDQ